MTCHPAPATGPDGVGMQLVRLKRSMETFRSRVIAAGGPGLESSGLAVLLHLTATGPMRTSRLAELLGLDPSTTSRQVAALERSGHVQRVADPDDGRAWLVQVSPAGREAFAAVRARRHALIARALESWTPAEVDAFAAALARFNDSALALDDATPAEPSAPGSPTTPAPRKDHR